MEFSGKVVWITGASSGIGRELARQLSVLGAKLILSSRNEQALEATRKLCASSEKHAILPVDLREYEHAEEWVAKAKDLFGRVDILVNNAGVSQRGVAIRTPVEVDRQLIELDYLAVVALSKAIIPQFIAQKAGYFVNVSSVAGKVGAPYRTGYSGAKHALIGFSDSLRYELTPYNIGVSVICPGYVRTEIAQNALNESAEAAKMGDSNIESGMPVELAVQKMIKAIRRETPEVLVASGLPWLGYHLRRLMPNTFLKLMPKIVPPKNSLEK